MAQFGTKTIESARSDLMRCVATTFVAVAICLYAVHAAAEEARASTAEAQAMVKKAIEYYKKVGREKAFQELSTPGGKFVDRDLYVTVNMLDGTCVSHVNNKMIGKNTIEMRDVDGKYFVRERLTAAKTEPSGWQDFKFFNPVSKKIEPKRQYWERYDGFVFATGAYKPD